MEGTTNGSGSGIGHRVIARCHPRKFLHPGDTCPTRVTWTLVPESKKEESKNGSCQKNSPPPRGQITKGGASKFRKKNFSKFFQNFETFVSSSFLILLGTKIGTKESSSFFGTKFRTNCS